MEKRSRLNGAPVTSLPPFVLNALANIPGSWGKAAKSWPVLKDMWSRRSSDDLAFMILLALNDFVTPIPSTQVKMGGDLSSVACMCTNCFDEIKACVGDPQCKAALDALAACKLNDQVQFQTRILSVSSKLRENSTAAESSILCYLWIADTCKSIKSWEAGCAMFRESVGPIGKLALSLARFACLKILTDKIFPRPSSPYTLVIRTLLWLVLMRLLLDTCTFHSTWAVFDKASVHGRSSEVYAALLHGFCYIGRLNPGPVHSITGMSKTWWSIIKRNKDNSFFGKPPARATALYQVKI